MRASAVAVAVLLVSAPMPATAQKSPGLEYAVKIICGETNLLKLARGHYFTAINVHNPGADTVRFGYVVSLTDVGQSAGPILPGRSDKLGRLQSLEIDCTTMVKDSTRAPTFMKGFAIIHSPSPLDVVAVYTAAAKIDSPVSVLEIERVPAHGAAVVNITR